VRKLNLGGDFRLIGGRNAYNVRRQVKALARRRELAELLARWPDDGRRRGGQAEMARRLGVSEATISRDVAFLRRQANAIRRCPVCGSLVHP